MKVRLVKGRPRGTVEELEQLLADTIDSLRLDHGIGDARIMSEVEAALEALGDGDG